MKKEVKGMYEWDVVFDGTDKVGKVSLSDGTSYAEAHFVDDDDAKFFYRMLCKLKDQRLEADNRLGRVMTALREALREGEKP